MRQLEAKPALFLGDLPPTSEVLFAYLRGYLDALEMFDEVKDAASDWDPTIDQYRPLTKGLEDDKQKFLELLRLFQNRD